MIFRSLKNHKTNENFNSKTWKHVVTNGIFLSLLQLQDLRFDKGFHLKCLATNLVMTVTMIQSLSRYITEIYLYINTHDMHIDIYIYISAFSAFLVIFSYKISLCHNLGLRHATRHGSLVYLSDDLPGTRICGTRNLVPQVVSMKPGLCVTCVLEIPPQGFPTKTASSHWQSRPPRELVIRYGEQLKHSKGMAE